MTRSSLIWIGVAALIAPNAIARTTPATPTRTVAVSLAAEHPGPAVLVAVPWNEEQGRAAARRWSVNLPGTLTITLDASKSWQFAIEGEDRWAQAITLEAGGGLGSIALDVHRGGALSGRLWRDPDRPDSPITTLEMELRRPPRPSERGAVRPAGPLVDNLPLASISCPVREDRFTCRVPAMALDLRLSVPGRMPVYRWEIAVAPAETFDLGQVKLVEGASLSAWVDGQAEAPVAPVSVRLQPIADLSSVRTESIRERMAQRVDTATVDERGFFQIRGVRPGHYRLIAEQEGPRRAVVESVEIRAGTETALDAPVVLSAPVVLEIAIQPPLDMHQHPWAVRINRVTEQGGIDPNGDPPSMADLGGFWSRTGLWPGRYHVRVIDSQDGSWFADAITVASGQATKLIDIPVVAIEGSISVGDEPVTGRLVFGASQAVRVTFDIDDGRFAGNLPREGLWELDLTDVEPSGGTMGLSPVEVKKRPGASVAKLRIALPDTMIEGDIVDTEGQPVVPSGARLLLGEGKQQRYRGMIRADRDGHFRIRGFAPGPVAVMAESADQRASDSMELSIGEGGSAEVTLVVRENIKLRGRVLADGQPVLGATVEITIVDRSGQRGAGHRAVTNHLGAFQVSSHEGFAYDVVVSSPYHAVSIQRVDKARIESGADLAIAAVGGSLRIGMEGVSGTLPESAGFPTIRHRNGEVALGTLMGHARLSTVDHSLVLGHLEPGHYTLCQTVAGARRCLEGHLVAGGELALAPATGAVDNGGDHGAVVQKADARQKGTRDREDRR